jgi:hypothetical protein
MIAAALEGDESKVAAFRAALAARLADRAEDLESDYAVAVLAATRV